LFIKFHYMLAARRRRRALEKIRREFARCGYPLDGVADAELEASLPPGTCEAPRPSGCEDHQPRPQAAAGPRRAVSRV
jgi:hypothetical protein